ncbi:hypothetical protein [Hazenella coriacea]|uniref:Competence protein CoiA-like N-terminal domain-containing protein n=1 Tax=Hazenella coriacea TaxID=1179467 RepID=A0A4R3L2S6_9BACL|nr:hypothetical protein [Hazenella coriacea]TCS92611.1 hypothetical protein EDD58_11175 [Hazenella coriacea]
MKIRSKFRQQYRLIPYGLRSDQSIVLPEEARPGMPYKCPECEERLILRTSKLKKLYFAHSQKGMCDLNQSPIALAKHVLHLTFKEWLEGKGVPIEVQTLCSPRHELPRTQIHKVKLENRPQTNEEKSFPHLYLLKQNGDLFLSIKLYYEKPLPNDSKDSTLKLSAEEVLTNPYLLSSLNPHSLTSFLQPDYIQLSLF